MRDCNSEEKPMVAALSLCADEEEKEAVSKRPWVHEISSHAVIVIACYHQTSTVTMPESKPFERLPQTVVPKHYGLLLKPDLKTFIFEGKETIDIQVKTSTNKIILNSLDLIIKSAELIQNGKSIKPSDIALSVEDETITLTFSEPLAIGGASLLFDFTGELNDKMKGFYRSKYKTHYSAVTMLCTTNARRMFPCWDEPALKARFTLSVVLRSNLLQALSNMVSI
uniref:Aminopeptidase N-like N-terminal domain-containing protein n=1 Tax=Timema bartmani TaxID=61472 RepID=A0A7R9F1S6_9NEOP|nr:unnamed protein product [Timema bartmani]